MLHYNCFLYYSTYICNTNIKLSEMKKITLVLALALATFISSCGGDKETDKPASIPGMTLVDLSGYEYNFPITLLVPDSTKGPMEITPQSWGAIEIKVGEEFYISIEQGDGENDDLKLIKSTEIDANEVHKVKTPYIIDEPNLVFYETQMLGSEDKKAFHFYGVFKLGDKNYVVEDMKGEMYSEAAAKQMLESAKSMTLKEKAKS